MQLADFVAKRCEEELPSKGIQTLTSSGQALNFLKTENTSILYRTYLKLSLDNPTPLTQKEYFAKIDKAIEQVASGQAKTLTKELQKELLGVRAIR